MLLHLLYIFAFTVLAILAMTNLIRNMITLGRDAQKPPTRNSPGGINPTGRAPQSDSVPHPEFLDEGGNVINEPLLVMRSITVDDAREKLDALYDASPSKSEEEE